MVAQKRPNDAVLTPVDGEGGADYAMAAAHEAGQVMPQYPDWVERLRPAGRETAAPVGPAGTRQLEAGPATVVEAPAATLGLEVTTPIVVDAGWLSRQLWRTVLGR